jgi:UDP-N-acetylglucosamine--N-acetylmuramyl-(pentapeptide) pyrophosphoryl-undecaprenol N-acetylglucosamine transferase
MVMIAAGGTGGHVLPATWLARASLDDGIKAAFCTDRRGVVYVGTLACSMMEQSITTSPRDLMYVSLAVSTLVRVWTLHKIRPRVVVGFGGYPSVPPVLAAQVLGIKTFIHEQNAVVRIANRHLSRMAARILTSCPQTAGVRSIERVTCGGNPTRFDDRYDTVKQPRNDIFTILIFGGRQDAVVFAQAVRSVVCELAKLHAIKMFHQCRHESVDNVSQIYPSYGVDHTVNNFFDNIGELYEHADLVIARTGASIIFEIIGFQKPSILVPFKDSINGDQKAYAEFLRSNGAAFVLDETADLRVRLMELLKDIINDRSKLTALSAALSPLRVRDCTQNVKRAVVDEVSKI